MTDNLDGGPSPLSEHDTSNRLSSRRHLGELWSPRLTALLITAILLLGVISLLASRSLATLNASNTGVAQTERVRFQISSVLQLLSDVETGMRGYALGGDKQFLDPFHAALPLLLQTLAILKQLIADSPLQLASEARLENIVLERVAHAQQVIQRIESGDGAGGRALISSGEGKRRMEAARGVAAQMQAEEMRLLELRRRSSDQALHDTELALWATGALAVTLLLAIAYSALRYGARIRRGEKTLATTLRSVGDAVISTDATGGVQFMNAVAEHLTGWAQKNARGRPLDEVFRIINEHTRAAVESPATKVMREGAIVGLANHTVLIAQDGTERPIEDSGAPIMDGEALVGVVLVFRDATTERSAQRALLASEQRFRAAVDAVQGILWTNTAEGEMRGEQPGWGALTGQRFDLYQGFGWANAVHPEDVQRTLDEWNNAVAARRPFVFEHRVKRHDGEWRAFSIRAIPTFTDKGDIREWVGVHTDITARKAAEAEQARLAAIVEQSHDFIGYADLTIRPLFVNAAGRRMVGLPNLESVIGTQIIDYFTPESQAVIQETVLPALKMDGYWGGDLNFRNFSTGTAIPVFYTLFCVRDATGGSIGYGTVTRDLTQSKRIEAALRASVQQAEAAGLAAVEAARQFTDLADNISQLAWMAEPNGSIFWYNKRWYEYTGTTLEGMRGWGWQAVHDPSELPKVLVRWQRSIARSEPFEMVFPLKGADGEFRPFLTRVVPIKDDAGKVARWFGTNTDISERLRAEELLRERERRFAGLANTIPQLAWSNQPDGTYEYFNQGWYAYTGLIEHQSLRADVWEHVVHPEDIQRTMQIWNHSLTVGEPYEVEFRLRRNDGAYRWFLTRAIADRDPEGHIVEWFGTCTDIDSTKRNEENLRVTEAALREADRRKDVFLATLSHELRNPLAPIRNAASFLENETLKPADVERSRLIIVRQVRHMASLLDDLLDMSRITRGVFALKKEYVNLQGLLGEAVETARPLIDAKRHTLKMEWPANPVEVEADPVRLVQIITNLLTNAAKYTDPEGHITLGVHTEDENIVIIVRDTGVGLAPEMLTHVFEMFAQVQPQQERTEGGLGIGLALVKGLVELHGGRIEARSKGLERGCEFVVTLPNLRVATGTMKQLSVDSEHNNARAARRVLIADDNRDGAESLAMILELAGHEVCVAQTGPEALQMAVKHRPQVAILDIGMPGMSGYEVARQIRREAWGAHMTLIAVTGWGQEDDKRQALRSGFDHHLTKPVDPATLEELLAPKDGV